MVLIVENLSEKIYSILHKIVNSELAIDDVKFILQVQRTKDSKFGDFTSNVAMRAFETVKSSNIAGARLHKLAVRAGSPFEMAQKIVKEVEKLNLDFFEKVEAVKPGFINFYLSKNYLQNQVQTIIQEGSSFGSSDIEKGKKASVEFVSANPTGPLHIGNARGGPLGDTIANVLEKVGYKVIREYLHNDVGGQVERLGEAIYFTIYPDKKAKDYEVQYQGEYVKELSIQISKNLSKDLSQEEFIEKAGGLAVGLMLDEILKDCEDMGIKFDKVTKESELRKEVPQVLSKLGKFIKEKDGAKWFAPNDEFLKDRETVVQKSDGNYTYFASDIVYHNEKMSRNDIVIDILGANHSGHEPRVRAVVKALGFDPNNLKVILYQWIRLKKGTEVLKMSKRAGTFVEAKEVLDEVGKDAFRFFLLMQNSSTHMDFDLELAKKKASDNPVFYVQYAHTRISSILSKIKSRNEANLSLLKEPEELALIRKLTEFPDLVKEVSKTFAVNNLTTYAVDLASLFHKFYESQRVISEDLKLTQARIALLKAMQITLKNTLDLLGVSAPEKM